jgi:hypothetical protein
MIMIEFFSLIAGLALSAQRIEKGANPAKKNVFKPLKIMAH